jgi:4-hydroxy-tetrahydrodipicolinate synthase
MFSGVYTALITPFKNDRVDFDALRKLIDIQYESGVSGIVPCGTTGESPTLSHQEHEEVLDFCAKYAKGKLKVLAGTGSNSTKEALRFTEFAKKVGCDGALIVCPYYNKPTQKGLYLHYKTITDSVDIPIILYSIASRASVNIEPETVAKLFNDCKNIVGIKEASGSLSQMSTIKYLVPDIELISGDDVLTLPVLSIGGVGVISVLSNIVPKDVTALFRAYEMGNIYEARDINNRLLPLAKAMFIETNPIPVKAAANMLGICEQDLRLPMCPMQNENKLKLINALKSFGLIK